MANGGGDYTMEILITKITLVSRRNIHRKSRGLINGHRIRKSFAFYKRLPQTWPVKLSSRASVPQSKRRFVYKTIVLNRCPFVCSDVHLSYFRPPSTASDRPSEPPVSFFLYILGSLYPLSIPQRRSTGIPLTEWITDVPLGIQKGLE